MKTAITVRLDPELLEAVRLCAERENRTLTNYIATALKERLRPEVEIGAKSQREHDRL